MAWLIAGAVALVLLAGLAAYAEVALVRVSRAGPREMARVSSRPERLPTVLAEIPRYVSLLALTRVCAEAAATVAVTAALVAWLGVTWHAFLISLAIMAAIFYLVTGIGPRTVGHANELRIAAAAANALYPLVRALGPVPALLFTIGTVLTPGRGGREAVSASEEELRGLVDLLEQRQVIEPGERAMIHSVFELGETIVREVMVPRTDIVFVERGKTVRQALSLALRSGFSRIPVVGENSDDVIGIAYLKDLVTRGQDHPGAESEKVESVMRPATFVPESKPIDELLREMQARQIHVAVVIDEYGGTAGLVTIEDILEEIVGEITDEYDREQPTVEWLAPERARVTSRLPVADLAELFGVHIQAEDVDTVGGLLAQRLGRVPIPGSVATVSGLRLTAESMAGRRNRIGTVTVERASPPPGGNGSAPAPQPAS
ncbi:MAG: HlyC/CorC family transporter [Actinobacteria bacterium]|nr:HlyC/CorC family transporter [Actinomycetota bacterium]